MNDSNRTTAGGRIRHHLGAVHLCTGIPGVVLGAAVLLAGVVDLLVGWLLPRLARLTRHDLDDELVRLLRGPTLKTIVLLGLMASASILQISEEAEATTRRSIATILIIVWCVFSARAAKVMLTSASQTTDRFFAVEARTYPLFDNLLKLLLFALCTFLVIDTWDLNAGGWMASAGIVGVAFGFAAQDTLGNLFAGVFIIADAPYKMGDFINLESGERGKVVNIGLRSTRLLTRDDVLVTIPNAVMGKARITNETAGESPRHRVRIKVSVAYGSDLPEVRRVLIEAAAGEELALYEPSADGPVVRTSVEWPAIEPDIALARVEDGGEEWAQTDAGTPGAPN